MTVSAVVLAVLGVLALFFPQELVTALQMDAAVQLPVQLLAGGLLGIAVLDWTGREAVYGGIYGRPIVLANFGCGMVTSGTLISALTDGAIDPRGWFLVVVFGAQALGFASLMWRPPWAVDKATAPESVEP